MNISHSNLSSCILYVPVLAIRVLISSVYDAYGKVLFDL
jgi:hypothetical protein